MCRFVSVYRKQTRGWTISRRKTEGLLRFVNTVLMHNLTSIDQSAAESVGIVCLLDPLDEPQLANETHWCTKTLVRVVCTHWNTIPLMYFGRYFLKWLVRSYLPVWLDFSIAYHPFHKKEHSNYRHFISLMSDYFIIRVAVATRAVIQMMLIICHRWLPEIQMSVNQLITYWSS